MADIRSHRVLYFKGPLFLALGVLASALLLLENPGLRTAALLAIAVWSFARAITSHFTWSHTTLTLDTGTRGSSRSCDT